MNKDGIISEEERTSFGWLGKMPKEVAEGPPHLVRRWKELAKRADEVARMRYSAKKIEEAKKIEAERRNIVETAQDIAMGVLGA